MRPRTTTENIQLIIELRSMLLTLQQDLSAGVDDYDPIIWEFIDDASRSLEAEMESINAHHVAGVRRYVPSMWY